ncbi:Glycoside hydrolase family 18 catalytic domain [Trinorchestia longiramus]|nr:Glycoside hydrolase family 18 catalytic domain [Trinorchestia longiramus]
MKLKNPNLRTIVSVGGSSVKAESFERIVSTKSSISNFTDNIVDFLQTKDMDGVEVDWQWPGQRGGSKDRNDLTLLMKSLRVALDDLSQEHKVKKREAETTEPNTSSAPASSATETATDETVQLIGDGETAFTTFYETGHGATDSTVPVETGKAPAPGTLSPGFDLTNMIGNFLSYA